MPELRPHRRRATSERPELRRSVKFLQSNLLVLVVGLAVVLAWVLPSPGAALQAFGLVSPLIAATFFCQGATVQAERFRAARQYVGLLAAGAVISFGLGPLLGWSAMQLAGWSPELRVGFVLMCCVGPTLVSGAVIAAQAGGEREAATLLTVVLNLAGIVLTPLALSYAVGAGASVSRLGLLLKLLTIVLAPALLGQLVRWRWPEQVKARAKLAGTLPVLLLGLIIYLSLTQHSDRLHQLPLVELLALALPAVVVHYLLLASAYLAGRRVLRRSAAQATALAIVASQKTLPVAVAVWSTELAHAYPLALLPPVVFHLSQVYGDSLLARPWRRRVVRVSDAPD